MTYAMTTIEVPVPDKAYAIISIGGETVYLDFRNLPEHIRGELMLNGALRVLRDSTAGKDDADAIAAVQKRVDAWMSGSWSIVARASSQDTLMFLALQRHIEAQTGKTVTDAWLAKHKLDAVKRDKGRVTWPEYAEARGKQLAKVKGETRSAAEIAAAMTETLEPIAEAIHKERMAAVADLDVEGVTF